MSQTILIAGCGDLGQRAAALLARHGHAVWGLRRHPPTPAPDGPLRWIAGDLTQPDSLRALPAGITRVLYTATPDGRDEAAYRRAFVQGLQHLTAALPGSVERIVFVSSSAVYGDHDGDWVDESTPTAPLGYNGRILVEAENWLADQPVRSIALRLGGLYGPGRLQLLERLRAGQARAPRDPVHWANRMHIDDAAAAAAHLLLLESAESVYVGADDTPLPLHTLYTDLAAQLGAPPVPEGPGPANVGSKRLRNARLKASGLTLRWPDARAGYAALIAADGALPGATATP